MKKVYIDTTHANMCISVFMNDAEVVYAGTTVNTMSVKHKNNEYQRFAEEYDIHFIFEDNVPKIDFYTIPKVDIFATDSAGGYIGSIGQPADLESDAPVCYINSEKKCYTIASNGEDFLSKAGSWKVQLMPYNGIEILDSFEMAQKKYEFIDRVSIETNLGNISV